MKDFFQKLKSGGQTTPDYSRVPLTLAAFGKHPGWDDHLPGIGLDTETLVFVKQSLYVNGIGGQTDSGAWEKLEAEKRLAGFDHVFLWLRPGHAVLGQFWSSRDGKGRTKYPMVICVDGEGASPEFLLAKAGPELDRLREQCKAAGSADQVIRECRSAQERLRSPGVPAGSLPPGITADRRRGFLDRPDFGPEHLGFMRVLHELGGTTGNTNDNRTAQTVFIRKLRSQHLRVPLGSDSWSESLLLWSAFLRSAVPESVSVLLIARTGSRWLDAIVGEPASSDFFCLQAGIKMVPLATEVPYELAPDAQARFRQLAAKFIAEGASEGKSRGGPSPVAPAAGKSPEASQPRPAGKGKWIALGAVILVAAAAFALLNLPGWREVLSQKPPAAEEKPGPPRQVQAPPTVTAPTPKPPARQEQTQVPASAPGYQAALDAAAQALAQTNLTEAATQANRALAAKPGDPRAAKLLAQIEERKAAIQQAAETMRNYETAMSAARTALDSTNLPEASRQIKLALAAKPGDTAAKGLATRIADLRSEIQAAEAAARKYQEALTAAKSALQATNLAEATRQAELALAARPGDAAALRVRDEAARLTAMRKQAASPSESAKKPFLNSIGMEFVWIPEDESRGVYVGKYEVTQKQYRAVMGKLPAGQLVSGDDMPVVVRVFSDAQEFCRKLGEKEGRQYSLPSREEWLRMASLPPEHIADAWAYLAGQGRFQNEVTSWRIDPPLKHPSRVGSRGAQTNGLCDLFGNLREWLDNKDSAGFSYDTEGYGQRKAVFIPGETLKGITGFRCVLHNLK